MDQRESLLNFSQPLASWQKFFPYVFLLGITLALYGNTVYFQFVWDDAYYIAQNYRVQGLSAAHLRSIWTHSFLGHYAPLHNSFLALLYHFFGENPFGYHLAQVLLHAACAGLLFFVLKKMELPRTALLASLLFAVHPTNIETVAWVSETKSTLAFFFFLLSFWAFLQFRERGQRWLGVLSGVFFVLSMLAKINTIVAPVVFLLYDYKEGKLDRKKAWSLAAFFLLSAIFAAIHLKSFYETPQVLGYSYYGGLGVHLQNLPLLILFYLRMVIFPHPLSAWHLLRIYETFHWVLAGSWMVLLGGIWLLSRLRRDLQFWALWFPVFLAPVLQVFPFSIIVAERYLYIPAIGLFVLWARLFFRVWDRLTSSWQKQGWALAMAVILLALAWHTENHLPLWRNDVTLWEATAQTCKSSADCHANLGLALLRNGNPQRGGEELIQAVLIRPAPRYLMYLGDAFALSARDYGRAILAYQRALEKTSIPGAGLASPVMAELYANLARAYCWAGDLDQASQAIQAGKRVEASHPRLWVVDGFLQWKRGNWEEARQSLRTAFVLSGQTSRPAAFLREHWGNAAEVGRLLSDLRSSPSPRASEETP